MSSRHFPQFAYQLCDSVIRKDALAELNYFPPVQGRERLALKTYFVTNTFLIFTPLTAQLQIGGWYGILGITICVMGLICTTYSLIEYCQKPGLKTSGIYKFSRNPMIIGYLLVFIGMSLLIGSWFHLGITLIYQIAVHWLVLSKERWCMAKYPVKFRNYCNNTPRYFLRE